MSLLHHVQDQHVWDIGSCVHDELTDVPRDDKGKPLEYFGPLEPVTEKLKTIVMDEKWLQSLHYYVNFRYTTNRNESLFTCIHRHTGALESLHNLMLMYCPKRVQFR